MAVVDKQSSWLLPPTARQTRAIALLAVRLGIKEPIEDRPSTRYEARQMIYELRRVANARI